MSDDALEEAVARAPGWAELIRGAPMGVLILCAILFFIGAGFVLAGFFLAFARADSGWMVWTMALVLGPVVLYLAVHLLLLTSWAWLAMVALLGLLVASSVVRAVGSPDVLLAPLGELVVEALCLYYLARRPTRRAFGWA